MDTRDRLPAPSPTKAAVVIPLGLPASLKGRLNQTILNMPGLLVYLPMTEGEGNRLFDASPNQRHAQLVNGAWIDGRGGKVVRFNGRSTFARLPAGPPLEFGPEDEFAFSILFRTKTGRGPLFALRGDVQDNHSWIAGMFDAQKNLLGVVRPSGDFGFPPLARVFPLETKQYLDNGWHHFVLNRRPAATCIEVWVDGHLAASLQEEPRAKGIFNPQFSCIGADWIFANARPDGPPFFEGDLTEFCAFNRCLTEEEIQRLKGSK